jgi:hypothetical protein
MAVLLLLAACGPSSGTDVTTTPDGGSTADGGLALYAIGGSFLIPAGKQGLLIATPGEPALDDPPNVWQFANKVPTGTAYDVTIEAQPGGGTTCAVIDGGVGTVGEEDVTTILLTCRTQLP